MLPPLPRGAQARYETAGLTLPTLEQVAEEQRFEKQQAFTRLKQLKYEERKRLAAPDASTVRSEDPAVATATTMRQQVASDSSGSSTEALAPPEAESEHADEGLSNALTPYERALAIKDLEEQDEGEVVVSNRYVQHHLRPAAIRGQLRIPFGEDGALDVYYEERLGIEVPSIRFGRDVAERGGAPPPVPKEYGALQHMPDTFGITESPNEFFPMRPPDVGPGDQLLYGGVNEELLLEQGQIFEVFRKHRSDPEHYTAERLAVEYDAPTEWIRLMLEYTTAPVFVQHDDQTYGVWEVVDGAMTEQEKKQVILHRRQVRAAADEDEEMLRLEAAGGGR